MIRKMEKNKKGMDKTELAKMIRDMADKDVDEYGVFRQFGCGYNKAMKQAASLVEAYGK